MKIQNPDLTFFEQTDSEAQSNMPPQLFQNWEHKNFTDLCSEFFFKSYNAVSRIVIVML